MKRPTVDSGRTRRRGSRPLSAASALAGPSSERHATNAAPPARTAPDKEMNGPALTDIASGGVTRANATEPATSMTPTPTTTSQPGRRVTPAPMVPTSIATPARRQSQPSSATPSRLAGPTTNHGETAPTSTSNAPAPIANQMNERSGRPVVVLIATPTRLRSPVDVSSGAVVIGDSLARDLDARHADHRRLCNIVSPTRPAAADTEAVSCPAAEDHAPSRRHPCSPTTYDDPAASRC